jgi:biopolymer transport protein ExbD
MKLISHLPQAGPALYIAPLINTVLLLLVFFFLGSNFIVQPGVSVTVPKSSSRLTGFDRARVITVAAMPEAQVYLDGQRMSLTQLSDALSAKTSTKRSAIIQGDVRAPYGKVMEVTTLVIGLGYEVAHATSATPTP